MTAQVWCVARPAACATIAVIWMLIWSAPARFREAVRHALAAIESLWWRR